MYYICSYLLTYFNTAKPIYTVYTYLKERGAEGMLKEPKMEIATRAIDQNTLEGQRKRRGDIRYEVRGKEHAVKQLARKYSSREISEDEIKWCLYSLGLLLLLLLLYLLSFLLSLFIQVITDLFFYNTEILLHI